MMRKINYPLWAARLALRNLTSPFRALPQVYLLGAPKCGTAFMYEIIRHHKNFVAPFYDTRELFFLQNLPNLKVYGFDGWIKFLFDILYGEYNGINSYRKFFPLKAKMRSIEKKTRCKAITADFTAVNLYCSEAASRIKRITPGAKLIILLRNPIDRAYSEYSVVAMNTPYEKRTFEKAIEDELNSVFQHNYLADWYIRKGVYEPYVRMYYEMFNKKQIMIVRSEDLFLDASKVVPKLFEFIGLPDEKFSPNYEDLFRNATFYGKKMRKETRQFLADYYRPFNHALNDLLKVDMSWD